MKIVKNLTFAVTAFLLSLLVQSSTVQAGGKPQIVVEFTKWVTTFPQMEGLVGSGVANGLFQGEVLKLVEVAGGRIWKLDASYSVISGEQSFTAIIHGQHSWHTGLGVLNGVIATGWHAGSPVHVEFEAIPDPVYGFVFQGTITIMPR